MGPEMMADYLGLKLTSPLVVGACPMTLEGEKVRELAIAGAGAMVLPSLFEEQIVRHLSAAEDSSLTRSGSAEDHDRYNGGIAAYLDTIAELKSRTGIPIIANLCGRTSGLWLDFAINLQKCGVDAIELNLRTDSLDASMGSEAIEEALLKSVCRVSDIVSVPVSVKLTPFFTNLSNITWRLTEVGAAGIVLFGHEPRWEVEADRLRSTTHWSLTPIGSLQTTLAGLVRVRSGAPVISIAASGGVSAPADAIQCVIAGADIVMVTSEVYRQGPDAVAHLVEGIRHYLERRNFNSFDDFKRSRPPIESRAHESSDYVRTMSEQTRFDDPTPEVTPKTGDRWGHMAN